MGPIGADSPPPSWLAGGGAAGLSFNNDGPLGTFFRYIDDSANYLARYDDLFTGTVERIDVSMNGIELQDRALLAAIVEGRAAEEGLVCDQGRA